MRDILSLLPARPVRCPGCRLRIDGQYFWDHRRCPACGATFRVRRYYFSTLYLLALVASVAIAHAVGNRGTAFTSLAVLLLFPTLFGMVAISRRLFPPDIDVVVPGWSPGDSEDDREIEREFELIRQSDPVIGPAESPAPPAIDPPENDSPGRSPFSTPKDPPVTLEGVVIAIAFAALLAYHLYTAIEPHVRRTSGP